jgi:predicted Zn-ribbon and HTH transcriptional regulator
MSKEMEVAEVQVKAKVDTQTFICPNCGGIIKYDIATEKFRCTSCKAESTIEVLSETVLEYDFSQYTEREKTSVAFEGVAVVHCQNCGCEITFDEFQIATTCPMCSSTQVTTVKQKGGIPPEGIIPFKIDKIEAGRKFKAWVKSRWFAPNDFKKKSNDEGSLKGMYLPFWTYDASAISAYSGEGGKRHVRTDSDGKLRTVTDWKPVSGVVGTSFDDVLMCATDKEKDIKGILPFNTVENTRPFAPSYLSGFHAELYSIKADEAFETAKKIMDEKLRSLAEEDIKRNYDEASVKKLDTKHSNVTYKHLLLPVWGSAFGYKGKTYNYFVNGETGLVDGQRPYSVPKIVLAVAGALAVIALLLFVI